MANEGRHTDTLTAAEKPERHEAYKRRCNDTTAGQGGQGGQGGRGQQSDMLTATEIRGGHKAYNGQCIDTAPGQEDPGRPGSPGSYLRFIDAQSCTQWTTLNRQASLHSIMCGRAPTHTQTQRVGPPCDVTTSTQARKHARTQARTHPPTDRQTKHAHTYTHTHTPPVHTCFMSVPRTSSMMVRRSVTCSCCEVQIGNRSEDRCRSGRMWNKYTAQTRLG